MTMFAASLSVSMLILLLLTYLRVFAEQEITGDVLLELDVNLLKSEIGIMAFGKRMRIANAITDLRRPPSIIYTDPLDLSQTSPMMHGHSPLSPHSFTHSRNQSQQSHS